MVHQRQFLRPQKGWSLTDRAEPSRAVNPLRPRPTGTAAPPEALPHRDPSRHRAAPRSEAVWINRPLIPLPRCPKSLAASWVTADPVRRAAVTARRNQLLARQKRVWAD